MSKVKGPFTYEALKPEDIKFVPLNQTKEMTGKELMTFYEVYKNFFECADYRMTNISENSCISLEILLFIQSFMIPIDMF